MKRLRQIAFVARDLADAERRLVHALGVERCYRDSHVAVFGLANALFPVGDQFLEIVSPVEDGTTAGRLLDRRGGDSGYMVLFQVDDLAPVEGRLQDLGVRVVFDAAIDDIRGLHLHPRDVPGAIVSIDAAREPAEWPWAGPSWRDHVRTDRVTGIAGVTVSDADPDRTVRIWSEVLDIEPDVDRRLELDDAVVRFAEPTSDGRVGITGLDVVAADPARRGEEVQLLGVTVRFT